MGMEVIYGLAEFAIPNMQMVFERAGFQIVGIVPASDRLMVALESSSGSTKQSMSKCWPPPPMFFARKPRV
jgi:hypothetical protein